jgi:hypothetical protein
VVNLIEIFLGYLFKFVVNLIDLLPGYLFKLVVNLIELLLGYYNVSSPEFIAIFWAHVLPPSVG